jgi:hypothetical protein
MIRYLLYKKKINNMDDTRIPRIASDFSQNHEQLKRGCHNDVKSWLNHWGIRKKLFCRTLMILKILFKLNLRIIFGAINNWRIKEN